MKRKITYIIQSKVYRVREYLDGKERTVGCFKRLDDAKVCQAGHHWIGGGLTPDIENNFGFIYLIEDALTGMKYIGKKQYYFYNGKCKSSNDITSKDFVMEAWDESDWRYYTSSSKILAPIIAERPNDFYFEILEECKSKLDLLTRD